MNVSFKNDRARSDYFEASAALRILIDHFISLSNKLGVIPVITRIAEPFSGEVSQTHMDGRACDFRNEIGVNGPKLYTNLQMVTLVEEMNARFPRGDNKPTCLHHSANTRNGRAPWHFHVQLEAKYKKDVEAFCRDHNIELKA
jgi:hypothetical protein